MTRLAALTGGSGFLGRHAIRALADRGWRVRMLVRRQPDLPELADIPIELVLGDLSDAAALRRLAAGADLIVHAAGAVKAAGEAGFMAANADGAAAMAAAWRDAAPQARFLLISSMAARAPHLSPYAASKAAGEARVADLAHGGDWRILRPAAIYGAHDRESLKILKLAAGPMQIALNDLAARVTMIDARDAAEAIACFAEAPGAGEIAELTDMRPDGYTWRELLTIAAAGFGRTPRPVRLPAAALKGLGGIGGAVAALTGRAEMLTPGKTAEILHPDWSADPNLMPPEGLWTPRIGLDQGLAEMIGWGRAEGLLPG